APRAAVAAVGDVADEEAVGDGEDPTEVVDGPPEGPAAGPAVAARAAGAAVTADGLVAGEEAGAHRCHGPAFDVQGTALGRGAIVPRGGRGSVALVAGEGAVRDVQDGLAPHASHAKLEEARPALVRFDGPSCGVEAEVVTARGQRQGLV